MIRRPPRSTPLYSSAASDVYKRQILDSAEPVNIHRCGVYIHPPYLSPVLLYPINQPDITGNKFRTVFRMFTVDQYKPLLTVFLKSHNLFPYLIIGECFSSGILVCDPETAILTVVSTFVPDIQGCKKNDSVAVDLFLQLPGTVFDLIGELTAGIDQHCRLCKSKPLLVKRF